LGDIGTYAWLARTTQISIFEDAELDGILLRYAGVNTATTLTQDAQGSQLSFAVPPGRWKAMGRCVSSTKDNRLRPSTLFLRIS
jgi:hypothetical protein